MKQISLFLLILLFSTPLWAQNFAKQAGRADALEDEVKAALDAADKPIQKEQAPAPVAASAVPVAEIPKTLFNPDIPWAQRYQDEPYIALVNDYQTTIKPDWSYEEVYHARIKIQKEEARNLSKWPIYYNKTRDSITEIRAHVENPDGRQYTTSDIQDMPVYDDAPMYQDMRMKLVSLEQVEVGSVIDVMVKSTTTRKEIPNQFWGEILYPAIPTKRAVHSFIIPDDKRIQLKSYKTNFTPLVEKSNGKTTYTFSFEDTGPLPVDEELMPPLQEILGANYLSTIADWKDVADWYRKLIVKNTIDDSEITVRTLQLVKGLKSQKLKARAILEFLQDSFRVIPLTFGDNTMLPHPTTGILTNRYGDSKDLALLAKQMLKIVGIEANTCLFSSEFAGDPQHGLPNPSVFASVILQMNLDGKSYVVDPMLKGYEFGVLPSMYDNATIFVIDDAGYRFERLPVSPASEHAMISSADIVITPDGSAEYRVHIQLPPETSVNFKKSWLGYSEEEKEQFFLNLEKNFAKEGKILDRQVSGIEGRYDPVQFNFRYQAVQAYPIVNDMILIKEEDQTDLPEFVSPSRRYSIFLPNNSVMKNTNTYHIPEGYKVGSLPPSYSLSIELMDATTTYQQQANEVRVDSTFASKRSHIPVERYNQVRDFRKELAKKSEKFIILQKTSGISEEAKAFIKSQ